MDKVEAVKIKKLADICKNPVLWAKVFLRTVDNASKKIVPWVARWYQAEMLLDESLNKVARCGRRTGRILPSIINCWEVIAFSPE